jgi:large subunit ribosomal protein L22
MGQVKAQLNGLRISPRKVRVVADLIRRKSVNDAINQLDHVTKNSAVHFKKLINSVIANAENNMDMERDNLYIKELAVDEGMKLKRYMPKGFGRAALIQKKTSRIRITLQEKVPGLKKQKQSVNRQKESAKESDVHAGHSEAIETIEKKEKDLRQSSERTSLEEKKRPEVEKEIGPKQNKLKNLGRKLFRRKSI